MDELTICILCLD